MPRLVWFLQRDMCDYISDLPITERKKKKNMSHVVKAHACLYLFAFASNSVSRTKREEKYLSTSIKN